VYSNFWGRNRKTDSRSGDLIWRNQLKLNKQVLFKALKQKAQPIFSPKQISNAVELIKKEGPELWSLWKELEDGPEDSRSKELMSGIRRILKTLNITKDLHEMTALTWGVHLRLRAELGLWAGKQLNSDQIHIAVDLIKIGNPDLWNQWKEYERNGESYQKIRPVLVNLLQHLSITKGPVEIQALITAVRMAVLVDAGIWSVDEISTCKTEREKTINEVLLTMMP
jgi:hypothetical protein